MTFYVDPKGVASSKLYSQTAPKMGTDFAGAKSKLDSIMRTPKAPEVGGPNISGIRRAVRSIPTSVNVPGLSSDVGKFRKGAGPFMLGSLAYDAAGGFQNQANRSVEDVESRGGFFQSSMKDAFPWAADLGEAAARLIHGPIKAGRFKDTPDSKPFIPSAPVPQATTGQTQQTVYEMPNSAPPVSQPVRNPLVRIDRPGQKSEYTNVPEQPGYATGTKIAMPDFSEARAMAQAPLAGRGSQEAPYRAPVAQFLEENPVPQFNARNASYGDMLAHRWDLANYGKRMLPAVAQQKQAGEQRRRDESNREFDLALRKFGVDTAFKEDDAARDYIRLSESRRAGDLNRIARLNKDTETKPLSYKEQLEEREALSGLGASMFPDAPPGFDTVVPDFVGYGVSLEQLRDAYNEVAAQQMQKWGVESAQELDPNNLVNGLMDFLGIVR